MSLKWQDYFWGEHGKGFQVLSERLDNSQQSLTEISNFYQFIVKLDNNDVLELQKMCKAQCFKSDQGTLATSLSHVQSTIDQISKLRQQCNQQIQSELDDVFNRYRDNQRRVRKQYETDMDRLTKQLKQDQTNVDRLKKEYLQKCTDMSKAIQIAGRGQTESMTKKEYEKIQEKAIKAKKDVDSCEAEYKQAIKKLDLTQDLWDDKMAESAKEFQKLENDRLVMTKLALKRIVDLQIDLICSKQKDLLQSLKQELETIDPEQDLDGYCRQLKTGETKPPRVTFQSYFGSSGSSSSLNNTKAALAQMRNPSLASVPPSPMSSSAPVEEAAASALVRLKSKIKSSKTDLTAKSTEALNSSQDLSQQHPQPQPQVPVFSMPELKAKLKNKSSSDVVNARQQDQNTQETTSKANEDHAEKITQSISNSKNVEKIVQSNNSLHRNAQSNSNLTTSETAASQSTANLNKQNTEKVVTSDNDGQGQSSLAKKISEKTVESLPKSDEKSVEAEKKSSEIIVETTLKEEPTKIETNANEEVSVNTNLDKEKSIASPDSGVFSPQLKLDQPQLGVNSPQAETKQQQQEVKQKVESNENVPDAIKDLKKVEEIQKSMEKLLSTSSLNADELPKKTFLRKSIKMEGWLEMYESAPDVRPWSKNWCVLEGGYIWVYENQTDANKPQGTSKPKSMISLAKVVFNKTVEASWNVPDLSQRPHAFSLIIGGRRQIACSVTQEDYPYWISSIDGLINKKK